jgi:hypothetical protein
MPHNKGMDWVRLPKRMALYFRDSFDCVWCRGVFPICTKGYGLTLDHVDPTKGNTPDNLVTCCGSCNSSKKDLSPTDWYRTLTERGYNVRRIKERVTRLTSKKLNLDAGRWLASLRRPKYATYSGGGSRNVFATDPGPDGRIRAAS